jgi:hypothetical protein
MSTATVTGECEYKRSGRAIAAGLTTGMLV